MEVKGNIIIISARPYDMETSDKLGRVRGITLQYYPHGDLLPCNGEREGERGARVLDGNLPYDFQSKVTCAPAVYEMQGILKSAKTGDGRKDIPTVQITDVRFLQEINIEPVKAKN